MVKLPTLSFDAQLLRCEDNAFLTESMVDDGKVLILTGSTELDNKTESVGEGDGLIYAVAAVKFRVTAFLMVVPCLADEMTTITCGIYEDIFRPRFYTALDSRFNIFVFALVGFKGKIIKINYEFLAGKLTKCIHDLGEVLYLMLGNLNKTKTLTEIFVGERLYAGGFAGAAVADKQCVVGRQIREEMPHLEAAKATP